MARPILFVAVSLWTALILCTSAQATIPAIDNNPCWGDVDVMCDDGLDDDGSCWVYVYPEDIGPMDYPPDPVPAGGCVA